MVCAVTQQHAISVKACLIRALLRVHSLWNESLLIPFFNVFNLVISDGEELLISKDITQIFGVICAVPSERHSIGGQGHFVSISRSCEGSGRSNNNAQCHCKLNQVV